MREVKEIKNADNIFIKLQKCFHLTGSAVY